jgi:hypothetical protein
MSVKDFSLYRASERKEFYLPIRLVALAVLGASIWILGIVVWSHSVLQSHPKSNPKVVSPHAIAEIEESNILEDLWPDDYEEIEFLEALHSCLDDCVDSKKRPAINVALLFPLGGIGLVFVDFVHAIARSHASHTPSEVWWIPTSHLPSSAQQYSHILRFANLPLLLAVGDALLHVASPTELTWVDVQETTRLLLSWHCQLSHLADRQSIPLLTMTMEKIEEDPFEQEMYLREFLPALEFYEYEDDANAHIDEDELAMSLQEMINRIKTTLKTLDQQFQKDAPKKGLPDKSLEALVKRIVKGYLREDVFCPAQEDLFIPSSPSAQRVYQFLQKGSPTDDEATCKDAAMSNYLVCRTLTPSFDTKSLVQEVIEAG